MVLERSRRGVRQSVMLKVGLYEKSANSALFSLLRTIILQIFLASHDYSSNLLAYIIFFVYLCTAKMKRGDYD
jgi:hypothetical protein